MQLARYIGAYYALARRQVQDDCVNVFLERDTPSADDDDDDDGVKAQWAGERFGMGL